MAGEKRKAMVIEDNKHTRFLVNAILTTCGFKVIEASDGQDGKTKLSQAENLDNLSAIFLDVLMPKINGIELLQWIKGQANLEHVPVLMLTTKDMAEDLIQGYGLGADYYIPKPFTKQQIEFGLDLLLSQEA